MVGKVAVLRKTHSFFANLPKEDRETIGSLDGFVSSFVESFSKGSSLKTRTINLQDDKINLGTCLDGNAFIEVIKLSHTIQDARL